MAVTGSTACAHYWHLGALGAPGGCAKKTFREEENQLSLAGPSSERGVGFINCLCPGLGTRGLRCSHAGLTHTAISGSVRLC